MKYLPVLILSLLLLFSCSKKEDKQNQVKPAVLLKKPLPRMNHLKTNPLTTMHYT